MSNVIKKPTIIFTGLICLVVVGLTLMFIFQLCPPQGPWPMPPWCGEGELIPYFSTGKVLFIVHVPECTPPGEPVCLTINKGTHYVMDYNGSNTWVKELNLRAWNYNTYWFSRACLGYESGEVIDMNETYEEWSKKHKLVVNKPFIIVNHTIKEWRWLPCNINVSLNFSDRPSFKPRPVFMKGVSIIDYWWNEFGISEYNITKNTARKVSELGDYVNIFSVYTINFNDYGISLQKNREISYAYTEENISYEIREYKKAGLKVNLLNTVWQSIPSEEYYKNRTDEWWDRYNNVVHEYLTSIARLAQREGAEMMQVGYGSDSLLAFATWAPHPKKVEKAWLDTIKEVKQIFDGKLIYTYVFCGRRDDPVYYFSDVLDPILKEVDYIGVSWWRGFTDNTNASLEELIDAINNEFDKVLKPLYDKYKKPIILIPAIPSAKGGYSGYYLAENETISPWLPPDEVPNDLEGQAIFYEALMRVVANKTWIAGVMPWGYWRVDLVDKSSNIRGKPAEEVLKDWFKLIDEAS